MSLIYNDPVFGSISWNKENTKIVFIAERSEKKYKALWGEEESKDEMASVLDKYNYDPSFGETLDKKKQP